MFVKIIHEAASGQVNNKVGKGREGPWKFGDAMVSHFQGVYW
jgi:hypothetical protein